VRTVPLVAGIDRTWSDGRPAATMVDSRRNPERVSMMKITIADDHPLVRDSLRVVIEGLFPDVCVYEAATADEVVALLKADPDIEILLLDLVMPGAHGLDLLKTVCAEYSTLKVIVLSASENPVDIRKALDTGASGYVPKISSPPVIISAIRLVLEGGVYIPQELLKAGPDDFAQRLRAAGDEYSQASITPRQNDVLRLLATGKSNKEIARKLNLSEHTVKIHVASLLRALGVTNRTQAALAAREHGLLDD
jgi:DNA-binding NarL/FixJ family response regulator